MNNATRIRTAFQTAQRGNKTMIRGSMNCSLFIPICATVAPAIEYLLNFSITETPPHSPSLPLHNQSRQSVCNKFNNKRSRLFNCYSRIAVDCPSFSQSVSLSVCLHFSLYSYVYTCVYVCVARVLDNICTFLQYRSLTPGRLFFFFFSVCISCYAGKTLYRLYQEKNTDRK